MVVETERLLTTEDLAERWGRPVESIRNDRYAGRGPSFIRLGHRTVRYRLSDILAWEAERVVEHSS